MKRSEAQKLWDLDAVLCLFDCANRTAPIDGNFKIQKLGFISELRAQKAKLRATHYKFFRYRHGPYSKDLANDVGFLKEQGFIDHLNRLTDRGNYILRYFGSDIAKNEAAAESIALLREVCHEFAELPGIELKRRVYEMSVPVIDYSNFNLKVKDIGFFTDILDPNRIADLRESANLSEDILADLKAEFSIPPETLDPDNEEVQLEVLALLEKIA